MAGGLALLKKLLAQGGQEARDVEREIGRQFYRLADEEPQMFQRGREFARGRAGLGDQFGVTFEQLANDSTGLGALVHPQPRAGYASSPSMAGVTFEGYSKVPLEPDVLSRDELLERFSPGHKFTQFDTSGLVTGEGQGGSGLGKRVYPAMYGSLLEQPGVYNLPMSLSARNEHRRTLNQAAALLRDRRLADRILIDPAQMRHGKSVRPVDFMNKPPEEQVGRLQAEGALETLRRVERAMNHSATFPEQRSGLRYIGQDTIPFAEDPYEFLADADRLRKSGAPPFLYDTVGASALKKAAIVNDIVSGKPLRRQLVPGLEYARGGQVLGAPSGGMGAAGCACGGDV